MIFNLRSHIDSLLVADSTSSMKMPPRGCWNSQWKLSGGS